MKNIKNIINTPRFKHGTAATVITIAVIVIISLIYVISIMINNKYDLSIDMTSNKIFEISQESKDYISNLDKDITIRVMLPEKDFINHPYYPQQYNQLNHILKMFNKYGKNISLVYDNIIKNPRLVDQYNKEGEISQYSVIVEAADKRYRVLNIDNLFEIEQNYMSSELKSSKAEQSVISAIVGITSDDQLKVGFLSGHEEADSSGFEKLLSDNLYEVINVNLLTSDIPRDLSLIVISAPQKDFTKEEIGKLNSYLENNGEYGKNILYLAGLTETPLINLNSFLNKWDINVDEAVVYDEANMTQLGEFSSLVEYSDQDLFKPLIEKNAYTIFLKSKPVRFINKETDNIKHSELISFSDSAVGLKYTEDSLEDVESATIKGPFGAIIKTSKGNDNKQSSLIVSGSVLSVDRALLYQLPVSNSDVYLKIIGNATDKKDIGINIASKEFNGDVINIKQNTVSLLRLIFIVLIPAVVVGTGLSVWISRRHK